MMVKKMKSCPTAEQMAITPMCHMISGLAATKEITVRISRLRISPSAVKPEEKRLEYIIIGIESTPIYHPPPALRLSEAGPGQGLCALQDCHDRHCDAFDVFKHVLAARAQELEGKIKVKRPKNFVGPGKKES